MIEKSKKVPSSRFDSDFVFPYGEVLPANEPFDRYQYADRKQLDLLYPVGNGTAHFIFEISCFVLALQK
jgi:hypothetical protein